MSTVAPKTRYKSLKRNTIRLELNYSPFLTDIEVFPLRPDNWRHYTPGPEPVLESNHFECLEESDPLKGRHNKILLLNAERNDQCRSNYHYYIKDSERANEEPELPFESPIVWHTLGSPQTDAKLNNKYNQNNDIKSQQNFIKNSRNKCLKTKFK